MGTINIQSTDLSHKAGLTYTGTSDKTIDVDSLVSSTNIKTVNSTSLLGSGDVAVQPTLISGTNIKTVSGISLLGSGDVSVGVGINQTWQDVTASRALGTTYTNSTGKPIMFSLATYGNTGAAAVTYYVNNIVVGIGQASATYYNNGLTGFIVPDGSTYKAVNTYQTNTLTNWSELR